MNTSLAPRLTKAASKQTYYTIRFLVDRPRREDAYRAYAYFRWVDDVLDGEAPRGAGSAVFGRFERQRFLEGSAPCLMEPFEANLRGTSTPMRRCSSSSSGMPSPRTAVWKPTCAT